MKNKTKLITLLITIGLIISIIIIDKYSKKDIASLVSLSESPEITYITTDDGSVIPVKKAPVVKDIPISDKELLLIDISNEAVSGWDVYENKEFKFGIKYPCDLICKESDIKPSKGEYMIETIHLPIIKNRLNIEIGVFTKESIESFTEYLQNLDPDTEIGDAQSFKFSLIDIEKVLLLPIESNVNLPVYNKELKIGEISSQIININNQKVIMLTGYSRYVSGREYFIKHSDNTWIRIRESYSNINGDLYDVSTLDEDAKKVISISDTILNTLYFVD